MREGKPSLTASIVALGRALYEEAPDEFSPTRDEHASSVLPAGMRALSKLARPLWSSSPALARQAFRLMTFGLSEHVALRTRAIDDAIERAVREGCAQLVTLGAGLDTRPWRMDALREVTAFEVDHPSTQQFKTKRVDPSGAKARAVRFVSVDFTKDSLSERLAAAGHDASAKTVWVLEGVSVYLPRAALEATLDALSQRSARGSALAFTYVPKAVLTRWSQGQKSIDAVTSAIGERFEGLLEQHEVRDMIESRRWSIDCDEGTREMAQRWMKAVDPDSVWERERVTIARSVAP
jgi:methyltransferase (TIGR00027 family)